MQFTMGGGMEFTQSHEISRVLVNKNDLES